MPKEMIVAQTYQHREYVMHEFVNRTKELEQIARRVEIGRLRNNIPQPLLNYWGVPGIGKSWFLRHVQNLYRFQPHPLTAGLRAPFAALFDFKEQDRDISPMAQIARTMTVQIQLQLGDAISPDVEDDLKQVLRMANKPRSLDRLIDAFTNAINLLSQDYVPILIFDSTESVDEQTRDDLEARIIEPIIWNDRVIIMVAGRRQIPRWKRLEVRRRVADTAETELKPFEQNAVRQQLDRWKFPGLAADVYSLSYGHPQTTELLGQALKRISEKAAVDSTFLIKSRRELTDLLTQVEEHVLEGMRPDLQAILELISVLRYFRIDPLRRFMTELDKEYQNKPDSFFLTEIIGPLEDSNLVWWSRQYRAYVASSVVRRIINRRLELLDHPNYIRRHQQALEMYLGWIQEFPKNASEFIVEAIFHLAMLNKNGDREQYKQGIQSRLKEAEDLDSDEVNTLYNEIKADRELADMLTAEDYTNLIQALDSLCKRKSRNSKS